jgi:hypothetical protein
MPDDHLYRFVVKLLCFPAAAFAVGIFLYQFRLRIVWLFVLGEAAIVLWYFLSAPTNYFDFSICVRDNSSESCRDVTISAPSFPYPLRFLTGHDLHRSTLRATRLSSDNLD